jgi:hypothetical protein
MRIELYLCICSYMLSKRRDEVDVKRRVPPTPDAAYRRAIGSSLDPPHR